MRDSHNARNRHQRGMVLIAVLWMVVALSIIVTGITRSVRDEARIMSLTRQGVEAYALGDAAIQLVLQDMVSRTAPISRLTQVEPVYRGVPMVVQIMPINGLIDINGASVSLLNSLYVVGGGLPADAAAALAQATVDARERKDSRGVPVPFEATEDLLQVPGLGYALYARLSGLITSDLRRGGGKVNPLAAQPEVLTVLAGGNAGVAARIAADREAGLEGIDTTALGADFTDIAAVQRFHIKARVPLSDGAWLWISRSVDLGARGHDGMPWHTFRTSYGFEHLHRKNS